MKALKVQNAVQKFYASQPLLYNSKSKNFICIKSKIFIWKAKNKENNECTQINLTFIYI